MYRTYRELYRGKVEIVSIGEGSGKIRLPRGMALTLDTAILGVVGVIVPGIPAAVFLHMFTPISPAISAPLIGFLVGWAASKFDPQGKTVVRWLYDYGSYWIRPHSHDGWKGFNKTPPLSLTTQVYGVEQGMSCSLPVIGTGDSIVLHRPAGVRMLKSGEWMVERARRPVKEGRYRIRNGKLMVDAAPIVRRKRKGSDFA